MKKRQIVKKLLDKRERNRKMQNVICGPEARVSYS
jgi:hypothetical protein